MKPPRLMAAIRGTTPANKLKAKERQFEKDEQGADAGAQENEAKKNSLLLVS